MLPDRGPIPNSDLVARCLKANTQEISCGGKGGYFLQEAGVLGKWQTNVSKTIFPFRRHGRFLRGRGRKWAGAGGTLHAGEAGTHQIIYSFKASRFLCSANNQGSQASLRKG